MARRRALDRPALYRRQFATEQKRNCDDNNYNDDNNNNIRFSGHGMPSGGGEEEKEEEEEEEAKVHLIGLNDINTAAISTEAVLINNAPALPIGVN